MAREWTRRGHDVHILTGPGDRGSEYTPDLVPEAVASGATVHRAEAPGIARPAHLLGVVDGTQRTVARPISRLRQILGQWKGFPDMQRSWIAPAASLGGTLHRKLHFDVAWSTSPPESVHFVGRRLASAGLPWLADFRDQWSEYLLARWEPVSRLLVDRITAYTLAPVAAVTANTMGVARSLGRAGGRDVVCVREASADQMLGILERVARSPA